jgi:hypothetical protein
MALSVLWLLVAAAYTEALATTVGVLLPQQQDIQASGTVLDLLVRLPSGPMSGLLLTINMQTWGFGYGIVLTGALVLSTPGWRLLSRIYWLGIAWAVLFLAQIIVIGIFGRIAYSSLLGDGNPGLLTFGYWLMYGVWLMLPPILWVAWSFKLWLPKLRAP